MTVSVQSTGQTALSGGDGRYTLRNVPSGPQTIVFRWLGYRPAQQEVTVEPGGTVTLDAALEAAPAILSDLVVQGASRAPERIVEAPAAISVVETRLLEHNARRLGESIAHCAQEWQADLIVVGTHGRRGMGRLLLGSGAEQIIRLATAPVLVIRASDVD